MEDISEVSRKTLKQISGSRKILKSHFSCPELAIFAKRCVCLTTCYDNMFPDTIKSIMPVFSQELNKLSDEGRADEMLAALADMKTDPAKQDDLLRFVSCFSSISLFVHHLFHWSLGLDELR